ncbi:MAG TPA: hypothetical protein VHZ73_13445 [Vicinamibacterales bacterium]|jgi:hypothetical protein|nr:hypothetical protein [Vicinamibacterales bacterium]
MSPSRAAREARAALMRMGRPHGSFDAGRYFRHSTDLGFLNVGTVRVRHMARDIVRQHADEWTVAEAAAFAEGLISDRHLEVKGLATEVLARYRRDREELRIQLGHDRQHVRPAHRPAACRASAARANGYRVAAAQELVGTPRAG